MYDIITFGSAVRDTYIKLKEENKFILKDKRLVEGKCLSFPVGSKIEARDMYVSSGGGGTNSAATFAKQGFKTAYVGKIGTDKRGEALAEEMRDIGVNTDFIARDKKHRTAYSLIISLRSGERTILVYRGASDFLTRKEIPWDEIKKARWFYLAPFSGKLAHLTKSLVDFAYKNKIKVALNPGYSQFNLPRRTLLDILKKVDVLILNEEEASKLTKIPHQKEEEIFRKIDEWVGGITIITKGTNGATAFNGGSFYCAPILDRKVADHTGAGDSFGSGFVSHLMRQKSNKEFKEETIKEALQLAVANATFCLGKMGAKEGLLRKGQKYPKVKIVKKNCDRQANNCRYKC